MIYDRTYSQIQTFLNEAETSGREVYSIAVLRNVILEPMEPYLRYALYRMGFSGEVRFGEYDAVAQDALDAESKLIQGADCVIVCEVLDLLSPKLAARFTELTAGDVDYEISYTATRASNMMQGLRRQTDAPVLWCGFVPPASPSLGLLETQGASGQLDAVRRLNVELREMVSQTHNAFFVDMEMIQARVGALRLFDNRWWYRGRAPYSREGLGAMAAEMATIIRAVSGKVKKVLVLDCDGVLWGGVVGEDGLEGIQLGPGHPGGSYMDFQQAVKELAARGVVIALNSKNNERDVWEVFDAHPHMVLSREDIVAHRINWVDKAANLRSLADELNLGLDSFVFCDDSPFECELVRSSLPQVEVVHLPVEDAYDNTSILKRCAYFDSLTYSREDRTKGAMYRAEADRRQFRDTATDMDAYLAGLGMRLEFALADDFTIPRIAQMTQKTNQFNLTTKRYTQDDIRNYAVSPEHDVVCVSLADRFGDMGIIGVAIIFRKQGVAWIDSLLLSCRALGRSVEDALLAEAVAVAAAAGAGEVVGVYAPTAKNGQVADFYSLRGFHSYSLDGMRGAFGDGAEGFIRSLSDGLTQVPDCFESVKRIAGQMHD